MMVVVVSPRWTYDAVVLTTLVAVQLCNPSPAPNAVSAAISTEMTILMICVLVIITNLLILISLYELER